MKTRTVARIMGSVFRNLPVYTLIFHLNTIQAQDVPEKDVIPTSAGPVEITFIGHGSLMMSFHGKVIHIDPYGSLADYAKLPKADLILITHEHGDHFDQKTIGMLTRSGTQVICTEKCAETYKGGTVMRNGETRNAGTIRIEAVPAYNLLNKRDATHPYHPKGEGNGYILTLGDKRIYVAGDTENTPEMKALKHIDVAFLPMNLPYTMTPEMVADAARAFRPKILYPYHFGETDPQKLVALLQNEKDIEVRVRKLK